MTRAGAGFVAFDTIVVLITKMVPQIFPRWIPSMANENYRAVCRDRLSSLLIVERAENALYVGTRGRSYVHNR